MRFCCVLLLAFCVICEVLSDYSEALLPSKEVRNRVHRTMRVNMRVGKRLRDAEYDDEAPKSRFRVVTRIGKRSFDGVAIKSPEDTDQLTYYDTYPLHFDTSNYGVVAAGIGKRSLDVADLSESHFLPHPDTNLNGQDAVFVAPKRKLRMIVRTGKRNSPQTTLNSLTPLTEQNEIPEDDTILAHVFSSPDFKRSAPQFLLNPRVGKNDKTWSILQKRNDPKATDMWFGPRIGRASGVQPEEYPWTYVIFNGNGMTSVPVLKSNDIDDQKDETSD